MKPRVAFFDFASCEGCQLQIANLEEDIVDLVQSVDVVSFREVMTEQSDEYDIAFIEGSIERPMDAERLRGIRTKAKVLIALGACACTGGVNKLRERWTPQDALKEVYGSADIGSNELFDATEARALDEVVKVDFYIRGCPVRKEQVLYYVKRLSTFPPHSNMDLRFDVASRALPVDERSIIIYDPNKCILCRRCAITCNDALGIHA
ncbi:MAG: hypothetical protein L0Z54_04435, partial [Thermoplasmata archaeon]|nr:hypothetical protein [Thermoplasmata archaeon]